MDFSKIVARVQHTHTVQDQWESIKKCANQSEFLMVEIATNRSVVACTHTHTPICASAHTVSIFLLEWEKIIALHNSQKSRVLMSKFLSLWKTSCMIYMIIQIIRIFFLIIEKICSHCTVYWWFVCVRVYFCLQRRSFNMS